MKRLVLFLVIVELTTIVVCGQKREVRPVSAFTGIKASSLFNITVTKGNTESLTIEAIDEVMPRVRSEVRDSVLHLYLVDNQNGNKRSEVKKLNAFIVMNNLEKVTLSGITKLTSKDLFTPESFKGDISGISSMTINVNTKQLNINMHGISKVKMNAEVTGNAELNLSGIPKVRGKLTADSVVINSRGASTINLKGRAGVLHTLNEAKSSNAPIIKYKHKRRMSKGANDSKRFTKIK